MAAGALLLAMQVAHGHDFWIEAEPYSQDAAGPVAVRHFKGETLPYIDSWIDRFELHDGMGMRPIEGVMGDDPAGSVQARTGGARRVATRQVQRLPRDGGDGVHPAAARTARPGRQAGP
jgi:hypothetical protein